MDDSFCQAPKEFRSVCQDLPTYGEHEGRLYCVLHFPGRKKERDTQFKKAVNKKREDQDLDFAGVYFPGDVRFSLLEKEADFSDVRFEKADFRKATFKEEANFSRAIFEEADFSEAIFEKEAGFSEARFEKANFHRTTFREEANFSEAIFAVSASFTNARFEKGYDFHDTIFGNRIDADESDIPKYTAGDAITIEGFEFQHKMNVVQVVAVFANDGHNEIELLSELQYEGQPNSEYSSEEGISKFSRVRLEGYVEAEDPPGLYQCQTINVRTAGRAERSFDNPPTNLRFEVVKEPTTKPQIRGSISLMEQRMSYSPPDTPGKS